MAEFAPGARHAHRWVPRDIVAMSLAQLHARPRLRLRQGQSRHLDAWIRSCHGAAQPLHSGSRFGSRGRMKNNTVSHFEIYANDPDGLARFYTQLFDWDVQSMPEMDYRFVRSVDVDGDNMPTLTGAINGGIARRPKGYGVNGTVNYVMVDSIEDCVKKAQSLGASLTKNKTAVPGRGWFAMFTDPEGNHFAVFKNDKSAK